MLARRPRRVVRRGLSSTTVATSSVAVANYRQRNSRRKSSSKNKFLCVRLHELFSYSGCRCMTQLQQPLLVFQRDF